MDYRRQHLNVVCVKWGRKFSADYVNRLYSMVKRNLSTPFLFHCLTDDPTGILPEVCIHKLPNGLHSWWGKLYTFSGVIKGDILFLDLDIVITSSIDWVENYRLNVFIGISDWLRLSHPSYYLNSSVMQTSSDYALYIWEYFIQHKKKVLEQHRGDQDYLGWLIPKADLSFYPEELITSHKFSTDHSKSSIRVYHGHPKPHEILNEPTVKTYWK